HDEIPSPDPATALDADTARRSEDLDDARGRGPDRRVAEDAFARWQRGRLRTDDRGERIDARQQVEQRARGQRRVELLDDRRALDLLAKRRPAGRQERE